MKDNEIKWYNWVGDPAWNTYCKLTLIFVICPGLVFMGLLIGLIFTGLVRLV